MAVAPQQVVVSSTSNRDSAYDAAFPSLGASVGCRQKADKRRKKITPTPVAAAQVDSTFLLAQPSEQIGGSFRRPAKSSEVDLRFLLREKRGQGKVYQSWATKESSLEADKKNPKEKAAASEGQDEGRRAWRNGKRGGVEVLGSSKTPEREKGPLQLWNQPPSETRCLSPAPPHVSDPKGNLLCTPPAGSFAEVPAKLSAARQRAAERHGAQLKDGAVASLLKELQAIVDLLTAQPTFCGSKHQEGNEADSEDIAFERSQQPGDEEGPGANRTRATETGPPESSPMTIMSWRGKVESVPVLREETGELEEEVLARAKLKPNVSLDPSIVAAFPVHDASDQQGRVPVKVAPPEDRAVDSALLPEASVQKGLLAFCCGDMAAAYACAVLEHSLPLILHCGEPVLVALLQEPAVARHSPCLTPVLQDALSAHQSSSLRGLGTPQKHSRVKSSGPLVALPFDEEQDSRNIPFFKTQEGQRLYTNREECRDAFYRIIRDAASTSTEFASEPHPQTLRFGKTLRTGTSSGFFEKPSFPRPEKPLDFSSKVAQFLAHLHADNYPWLAKLLVQQIIQVASTGETDPEVRNLAREDTAKLQRLHSRLVGSGPASMRLAAGGTPTRESPGSRLRSLSGKSPVGVTGALVSSPHSGLRMTASDEPGREGDQKTSDLLQLERDVVGKQREGASTKSRKQTVRRTLEGLFQGTEREAIEKTGQSAAKSSNAFPTLNGCPNPESATVRTAPISLAEHSNGPSLQRDASLRKGLSVAVTKQSDPLAEGGIFGGLFSRSLSPYVRFLQAADSHRLHVLLIRCICESIDTLSRVTPGSVFSSSSFSERVVTLQNLARFLGFLLFASVSDGHVSPTPVLNVPVYTWSGELPLSLVGALRSAVENGSLGLTLPWILEILGMMRNCPPAHNSPTFVQAVAEVEHLRAMPALSPSDASFRLPSMCLVAALDGFFREDPTLSTNTPRNLEPGSASWPPRDSPDSLGGLIDSRYIQNCCPVLEELALTLLEAAERRRSDGADDAKPADRRMRPIRKITPTTPPPGGLPADVLDALPSEDLELARPRPKDPLKARLESVFFEQQPHLRRLVDFVVDVVSSNSGLAAQLATCPGAVEGARALSLEEKDVREAITEGRFDALVVQAISDACRRALSPAIAYARKHSHERVCEALSALARPNIAPSILGTAAAVAAQASALRAVKILLINLPKEIRKSVLEDAEKVKKRVVAVMRQPVRERSEQEGTCHVY